MPIRSRRAHSSGSTVPHAGQPARARARYVLLALDLAGQRVPTAYGTSMATEVYLSVPIKRPCCTPTGSRWLPSRRQASRVGQLVERRRGSPSSQSGLAPPAGPALPEHRRPATRARRPRRRSGPAQPPGSSKHAYCLPSGASTMLNRHWPRRPTTTAAKAMRSEARSPSREATRRAPTCSSAAWRPHRRSSRR